MKKSLAWSDQTLSFVLALPILPVRHQTSIFGASELNCRVRNGNGWTLTAINPDLLSFEKESKQRKLQTAGPWKRSRTSAVFLSLPSFSTLRYYILFSAFCQDLFCVSQPNPMQTWLRNIWCAFRDSNPGPPD